MGRPTKRQRQVPADALVNITSWNGQILEVPNVLPSDFNAGTGDAWDDNIWRDTLFGYSSESSPENDEIPFTPIANSAAERTFGPLVSNPFPDLAQDVEGEAEI